MEKFCIWVVSPKNDIRQRAFDDIAVGLKEAFRVLGYEAPIVSRREQVLGRPIILATNLLYRIDTRNIPPEAILYNFEQVSTDNPWITNDYLSLLKRHWVWDYSKTNIFR